MADIILYGDPRSTFFRTARMAAEEKAVSYDMVAPGDAGRDYAQLHPYGKIPAMAHGDITIYETAGIVSYIDEAFEGPALIPSSAHGKALAWQWVSAVNDYFYSAIIKNYVLQYVFPKGADGQPDMAAIEAALPEVKHRKMVLDAALADSDFLAGASFSIADMFVAPIMAYLGRMPEASDILSECQNIGRAGAEVMARPSYINTAPPMAEAAE